MALLADSRWAATPRDVLIRQRPTLGHPDHHRLGDEVATGGAVRRPDVNLGGAEPGESAGLQRRQAASAAPLPACSTPAEYCCWRDNGPLCRTTTCGPISCHLPALTRRPMTCRPTPTLSSWPRLSTRSCRADRSARRWARSGLGGGTSPGWPRRRTAGCPCTGRVRAPLLWTSAGWRGSDTRTVSEPRQPRVRVPPEHRRSQADRRGVRERAEGLRLAIQGPGDGVP